MKPALLALGSMLCYAVINFLIEKNFSKYHSLTIVAVYASVLALGALTVRALIKDEDQVYDFPTGLNMLILISIGLIFLVGDYFLVSAYTCGGSIMTVTSISILVPVFGSILKYAFTKQLPNIWQFAGYGFAAVAVMLVIKGNTLETR